MASISSLTSSTSSTSSLYGNRNVLSGLASGMDTETMIENAVSGIKAKITSIQQKQTKVEWQQEAYRSIIDKMANFLDKYTSYASSTNLFSSSFFNNAVTTTTSGTYSDLITASGKTSSNIQVLGVKQLATAATYKVSGSALTGSNTKTIATDAFDLSSSDTYKQSNISGSLTINVGNRAVSLTVDKNTVYESGQELADAFNEQLQNVDNGSWVTAVWEDDKITFKPKNSSDAVYIQSVSGDIKSTLGIKSGTLKDGTDSIAIPNANKLYTEKTRSDILSNGSLSFTLDGVTKTIDTSDLDLSSSDALLSGLQSKIDKAFGTGKITVGNTGTDGKTQLTFTMEQDGSTLKIAGTAAEALGLGTSGKSNYLDTSTTLGDILGDKFNWDDQANWIKATGTVTESTETPGIGTDEDGNTVKQIGDQWYRANDDGEILVDFKVNGQSVGAFSKSTAMEKVMTAINSSADAGVSVSYSKTTNQFLFSADDTGAAGAIEFGDGLAKALFGDTNAAEGDTDYKGTFEKGTDAILSMSVNGSTLTDVTRSSNSFAVDGLTINLKGTFNYDNKDSTGYTLAAVNDKGEILGEDGQPVKGSKGTVATTKNGAYVSDDGYLMKADGTIFKDGSGQPIKCAAQTTSLVSTAKNDAVSFTTSSDSDKIVDAVKSMVEDYNAMVTEIKKAYSTQPATNSSGDRYEPLTDDDRADMSDSAISAYEEKAKQGILFGDSDLSSLYNSLRSIISSSGSDGSYLRSIGISTAYSDGLTTIEFNETKFRSALESDADGVRDAFTKSTSSGSSTNGLMQKLKNTLETYGKTTGSKGILVNKAGSTKAPTSLLSNTLKDKIDNYEKQIEKWQDKLSDKIDYYTTQFTRLEQLISEMNSQSSTLSSLTGSY